MKNSFVCHFELNRHPREGGDPLFNKNSLYFCDTFLQNFLASILYFPWVPAFAGMTNWIKPFIPRTQIILTAFLFLSADTLIAHSSLFFKDQEITPRNNSLEHVSNPENLSLHAILFQDPHQWSVWIGNQIIHSENRDELKDFQIEKVCETSVTLSKRVQEGEIKRSVTLYPYPMQINTVLSPAHELPAYDLEKAEAQKK
jgi:hypothetical protein